MARYQIDDEPLTFQPYMPGKVAVSRGVFYTLCVFAFLGAIFLVMVLFAA